MKRKHSESATEKLVGRIEGFSLLPNRPAENRRRLMLFDSEKVQLKEISDRMSEVTEIGNLTVLFLALIRVLSTTFWTRDVRFMPAITDVFDHCKKFLLELKENHPENWKALCDALNEGKTRGIWDDLMNLHFIIKTHAHEPIKKKEMNAQQIATFLSWGEEYKGNVATMLWKYIVYHYRACDSEQRPMYANVCAIAQSLGMGKSRTVLELGKTHFLIPLCLRSSEDSGIPPPDTAVRDYFIQSGSYTRREAYILSLAFLAALFAETTKVVQLLKSEGKYETLARESHTSMTTFERPDTPCKYRTDLCDRVVQSARNYRDQISDLERSSSKVSIHGSPSTAADYDLHLMAKSNLEKLLSEFVPGVGSDTNPQPSDEPVIIVAFDEADILKGDAFGRYIGEDDSDSGTDSDSRAEAADGCRKAKSFEGYGTAKSSVSSFQQRARCPNSPPLVVKMLQPAYDTGDIYPCPHSQTWAMMHLQIEWTVDDGKLEYRKVNDSQRVYTVWSLEEASRVRFMVTFGRPLFVLLYWRGSHDVQREIVRFAAAKLLHADLKRIDFKCLNVAQTFACLSSRLAIELDASPINSFLEKKQVRAHMRLCIGAETLSGSEPLLAEAAAWIMRKDGFHPPRALERVLQSFAVNSRDRSKLIAMLLLTMARDDAAYKEDPTSIWLRSDTSVRLLMVTVKSFMGFLIKSSFMESHVVQEMYNSFSDAHMHFNHFVKPSEEGTCTMEYLIRNMVRGAALRCATDEHEINLVLPILLGTNFSTLHMSFILVQARVWDGATFEGDSKRLFNDMDPEVPGLWGKVETPKPIIRIIFSLSSKPDVQWTKRVLRHNNKLYYSYDCWIGGLDPDCLRSVNSRDQKLWEALDPEIGWQDVYMNASGSKSATLMSMDPGRGVDKGF